MESSLHDPSLKQLKFFLGDGGWGAIKSRPTGKLGGTRRRDGAAAGGMWRHLAFKNRGDAPDCAVRGALAGSIGGVHVAQFSGATSDARKLVFFRDSCSSLIKNQKRSKQEFLVYNRKCSLSFWVLLCREPYPPWSSLQTMPQPRVAHGSNRARVASVRTRHAVKALDLCFRLEIEDST